MCSRTWRGKTGREHDKKIFPYLILLFFAFSWRFESLKSRCVLIDRENLLTEHNITFKPMNAMEFDIKEAQLQAALPRIVSVAAAANCGRDTPPPEVVTTLDTPLKATLDGEKETIDLITPLKVENPPMKIIQAEVQLKQELPTLEQPDQVLCKVEPQEEEENVTAAVEELVAKPIKKGTPVKPRVGVIKVKTDEQLMSPKQTDDLQQPAKPTRKGIPVKIKTELMEDEESLPLPAKPQLKGTPVKVKEEALDAHIVESKPLRKGTPVRVKTSEVEHPGQVRSILAKKRDLFTEDSHKNVQFSSSDPIVHNLSPDVPSPPTCSKENEKPAAQDIKPVKKTQNIIRRIVVAPKKGTFTLK